MMACFDKLALEKKIGLSYANLSGGRNSPRKLISTRIDLSWDLFTNSLTTFTNKKYIICRESATISIRLFEMLILRPNLPKADSC